MKILLVDTVQNIRRLHNSLSDFYSYSIGLLSLATILREKKYDVEIINFEYLFNINILAYDADPVKNFDSMAEYIINKIPDVVGFTSVCNSFHNSLFLSRLIKKGNDKIKVLYGGPHASILPEKIMEEYEWIDLICTGEGENKIVEIIKGLEENDLDLVPGIVYRKEDKILRNKEQDMIINLDELPMLNYDLIPYFRQCEYIPLEIGRGCPYNCIYCSTATYWKHKFRLKSIERIFKEISFMKNILGNNKVSFVFIHDNFTTNHKFAMSLCEKLQELSIEWFCSARIDQLDEELINRMIEGGCKEVFVGIESASPRIQKYIKKKLDLKKVDEVASIISKTNLEMTASFMYGFPGETEEDLNLTLHMIHYLLKKRVGSCQFNTLCILNGTELFEKFSDKLVLRDYYSGLVNSPSNFDLCGSFIRKNKELFSHFYILEGSLADKYVLLENFICFIFIPLYDCFPKTFDLMIKAFEGDMVKFYNDFILNSDNRFIDFFKNGEYIRDFIEEAEIFEMMITFLEGYINKKSGSEFKLIFNTFDMESLKFRLKRHSVKTGIRTKVLRNRENSGDKK